MKNDNIKQDIFNKIFKDVFSRYEIKNDKIIISLKYFNKLLIDELTKISNKVIKSSNQVTFQINSNDDFELDATLLRLLGINKHEINIKKSKE